MLGLQPVQRDRRHARACAPGRAGRVRDADRRHLLQADPMFVLSDLRSVRRAAWSLGLLNAGLLVCSSRSSCKAGSSPCSPQWPSPGLVLYGLEIRAILRTRVRRVAGLGRALFPDGDRAAGAGVRSWASCSPGRGCPPPAFTRSPRMFMVRGFARVGDLSRSWHTLQDRAVPRVFHRYSGEIAARRCRRWPRCTRAFAGAGYWTFVGGMAMTSVATALATSWPSVGDASCWRRALAVFALKHGQDPQPLDQAPGSSPPCRRCI